jgi:hypothetical protein
MAAIFDNSRTFHELVQKHRRNWAEHALRADRSAVFGDRSEHVTFYVLETDAL